MILNDIVYQNGEYFTYYDKNADCFVIAKDGLVCGTIVCHASTFEQAKESIEWHKRKG